MFAAANTTLIQLFATYTFENIGNLKGHNGKVREKEENRAEEWWSHISIPDTTPTIFHLAFVPPRSAVCCGILMTAILFLVGWMGQYTIGTSRMSRGKESVS